MAYLDIWSHVFSTLVTILLAFSPGIAHLVAPPRNDSQSTTEVAVIPEQKSSTPSLFDAFSDSIKTQLRADERYQQAAVAEAVATPAPISTASIEAALVNIFCTAQREGGMRTITGSGVFIDERGVILTNAHIAQFLLLTEDTAQTQTRCVIRQGSPALSKYTAELLYISPVWITKNADQLSSEKPSGTGEHDFALLYVTEALEGNMPKTFPFLAPAQASYLFNAMPVRGAGYPAELLTADDTRAPLIPTIATTSITHLFTFGSGDVDLVAIAPSAVGQQGSSGGPIVDADGSVVGLIVTRGNVPEEGMQSLRALTLPYIDRMLMEETGLDLAHTIAGDTALRAEVFRQTLAPYLRTLLLDTL